MFLSDAHDGSVLNGVTLPTWASDRHWVPTEAEASSESRDMSWASGALVASSWILSDERRLSYSLSAMKLVTVGGQVHEQSPGLPRSFSSTVALSTMSLAMTRSSSYQEEVAMH